MVTEYNSYTYIIRKVKPKYTFVPLTQKNIGNKTTHTYVLHMCI